jgi:hypothetical protein
VLKFAARGVHGNPRPDSTTSRDRTVTDSPVPVSRQRAAVSVFLGLLATLITVLGMVCYDTHHQAVHPVAAISSAQDPRDAPDAQAPLDGTQALSDASDSLGPDAREHLCPVPDHDECEGRAAADTPTTGPGSHPLPQAALARVEPRPAAAPAPLAGRPAARPPDLHMLQVLRT